MTEAEYIDTTNLARVRDMRSVFNGVHPMTENPECELARIRILHDLDILEARLAKKVKTK